MGKNITGQFHLPDAQGWHDIRLNCKLQTDQITALEAALELVLAQSSQQPDSPSDAELKKALGRLDNTFERLARILKNKDVTQALSVIESYGATGNLLSATTLAELGTDRDVEVSRTSIARLLQRTEFEDKPIMASQLDALSLPDRQRHASANFASDMRFAIQAMRQPISAWLTNASQDKGGNRTKSVRERLVFTLACKSLDIIGETAASNPKGSFFNLCTHVVNACGVDDAGLEDAVRRCLERNKKWIEWNYLPRHSIEIDGTGVER